MSVARLSSGDINQDSKRARVEIPLVMGFSDEDKIGTIQPHDDALVITLRIGGYNVKRVMVDQRSAEIILSALLIEFLRRNIDVFSWNAYEAPRVNPEFICHHLKVNPLIPPRKRPPRRPSKKHAVAVREEVSKLKQARGIREVFFYLEWLANTVVVKKKNEKWRVCVDFTDLNKACPKDPFPMPKIDQLVDATVGHPRMSFLDAFQGYHQIPLALDDQEKTAFVTSVGNYHYKVMPFGLKNAGSSYQRMMTRMFGSQLGKNIEIYIDNMVVKSKVVLEHLGDLGNIFEILRKYKLRLNASKCSFDMGSDKFLGYMVTHRGIEVNPNQIQAINNLQPPRNPKKVQKLTEMAAALN